MITHHDKSLRHCSFVFLRGARTSACMRCLFIHDGYPSVDATLGVGLFQKIKSEATSDECVVRFPSSRVVISGFSSLIVVEAYTDVGPKPCWSNAGETAPFPLAPRIVV